MLSKIEDIRVRVSRATDAAKKANYGQFFTPWCIADFMAGLFSIEKTCQIRLLDAGAGVGSLSWAFLEKWHDCGSYSHIELDAYEIDENLHGHLADSLSTFSSMGHVNLNLHQRDFIRTAVDLLRGDLFSQKQPRYTHAILNPPYKKIRSDSIHRTLLRRVGIETVNLYSAFVALALELLQDNGQLVAIIPRSFCNGPYYRPFREFILQRASIRHMHLFEARNTAFQDDDVLQENIIILLERGAKQENVTVTTSTDATYSDIKKHCHNFDRIVIPGDTERFIHIPVANGPSLIEEWSGVRCTLQQLDLKVSTGPVVDFRVKEYLKSKPEPGTVPLLYPKHFTKNGTEWPNLAIKKPNAICVHEITAKGFFENGYYCVVRRFSSKEEKRRIVANVVEPQIFGDTSYLAFENHLNVYHCGRKGLAKELAYGLATYLNTAAVDEAFRRFSGHTQVNATDLRLLKYPSKTALVALGRWALKSKNVFADADVTMQMESLCA